MFSLFSPAPSLVNKKIAQDLIKNYVREHNWHESDLATGNLGFGWIHYALIRILRPKRILCIGSKYGFIPIICALACNDNDYGIVDFVDAGFDENDPSQHGHWGGIGVWKNIVPEKYFGKFGVSKHIKLHVITTQDFIKSDRSTRWDYIYLDGDHSYKGTKHDFDAFWPRLNKNGIMAFHDINVKRINELVFGVYKLWENIKRLHPNSTIELPGSIGVGLLTKYNKRKLFDNHFDSLRHV